MDFNFLNSGSGSDDGWDKKDSIDSKLKYDIADDCSKGSSRGGRVDGISSIITLGVLIGAVCLLTSLNFSAVAALFGAIVILALVGLGLIAISKIL